jgi:streptogramin lyase
LSTLTLPSKKAALGFALLVATLLLLLPALRDHNPKLQNASGSGSENLAYAFDSNIGNETNPLYNSTHVVTPYIQEYSMPNGTWPNGIFVDSSGIVWTVGTKSHSLLSFDPKEGRITASYLIPSEGKKSTAQYNGSSSSGQIGVTMAWTIVQDKKGSIWFSQADSPNPLWRFDPTTKKFESIHLVSAAPYQMKVDNTTGNIWYTTFTNNKLGVIQEISKKNTLTTNKNNDSNSSAAAAPPQYNVTEFDLGTESFPSGLYLHKDSVWVTQSLNDKLVQFKIVRDLDGRVINILKTTEIPSPEVSSKSQNIFDSPYDIVVLGSNVWVTEHDVNFLTKYDINSKSITKFATSGNPHQYVTLPFWLREGVGGGLWFNEHYGNRMAFFNTTDMTLTEYEIPTRDPNLGYITNALNFAVDPTDNGDIWFSEYNHDKIGVVKSRVSIPFDIHSSVNKVLLSKPKAISDIRGKGINASRTNTLISFEISKVTNGTNNYTGNSNSSALSFTKNNKNGHEIVYFKTSSSMTHYGVLNSSANFSRNYIDLTEMKDRTAQVHLSILNDYKISPGNYTLGISATDGRVTKSIYPDLIVK